MSTRSRAQIWSAYLAASLLLLAVLAGPWYPLVVGAGALVLAALTLPPSRTWHPSFRDATIVGALYVVCVGLFYLAFQVVTVEREMMLFVIFGAGLLLGVAGSLVHVVIVQRRPLADIGLTRHRLGETMALGALLAGVQVAITFPLVSFGAPQTWLPLLVLALTVGLFEAVFFRGYLLAILEPMVGVVPAVGIAVVLYALYHVGYGMTGEEMLFLGGLGIVYAVAYAVTRNLAVLWPLLTPLGSFFADVRGGEIELPMIAILGFVDVIVLMALATWLVHRWANRRALRQVRSGQVALSGAPSRR